MALIVMLSVVALLPVSGATSGCVGKCFPGSNDQYQGKLVALSNEISDTHEPSSLDILSYFAYEKTGQKFYGNGTKFDSEGDYQRTQMLQLNDAVKRSSHFIRSLLSPEFRCVAASTCTVRNNQRELHGRQAGNGRRCVCSKYTAARLLIGCCKPD